MNWEYCSALASNVSSCAFLASGLSFASRFMDLSVAAAACKSTGALVGVVSVAWDWSNRAVTRASSSACSSGSSSMEPAAWRLRWVTWFVAVAFERSRSRGRRLARYRRRRPLARRWFVEPSTRDANLCCSCRRRAPPGAIDAYVTTLRNALARGGRAFRRAVLRGLVRLLAIAAHGAHCWSSAVQGMISLLGR